MKRKLLFLNMILLLIFLLSPNVFANEYLSDKTETNYNSNNGLLTGKANTICQTADGYIWIGQYAGLTRYDAKSFTTITAYNDYNITGITALAAYGNSLVIGTQSGLFVRYDNGKIKSLSETLTDKIAINDIKVYGDIAFIASDTGVFLYSFSTDKLSLNSGGKGDITKVAPISDDQYFYVTSLDKVYGNLSPDSIYYGETNIKSIYFDGTLLYLGERSGGVVVIDNRGAVVKRIELDGEQCVNDILSSNGSLYIATDKGLFVSYGDTKAKKVDKLEVKESLQRIIVDYEGNIWIASSLFGVSKITTNELFDYYFEHNLDASSVNAIIKYNGLTYIATSEGLDVIDEENNLTINNELTNMLNDVRIRDLEVYKNKLYIATYDSNDYDLLEYDGTNINNIASSNLIEQGEYDDSKAKNIRCVTVAEDYLLIGTNYGITRFDGTNYYTKKLDKRVLYIYYANDTVYLALEKSGFATINLELGHPMLISDKYSSPLKCLYVNGGLLFNDNNFLYFYKDGEISLINNTLIGSIVELEYIDNRYIVGTDTNVYIFDNIFDKNSNYIVLDNNNGLKSSLVGNSSGYYDKDNNCYYFATSSGVFVYDLARGKAENIKRKIAIDSIVVDDQVFTGNEINIKPNAKRISVSVAVLSYSTNQHYNIYYKLDGVDNDYQAIGSTDSFKIDYTNLKGGKYTLTIYSKDFDGTISNNTILLTINKQKAVHEQAWFWVIIVLLSLALFGLLNYLLIHNKAVKAKKREAELKGITIESIEAIARTIDVKDTYTNGHSIRVGHFSRIIAKKLGMEGDELENLYYTALLHDIGKIGIPDAILNKPGKLTDEEYAQMKSHTTKGAKILKDISTIPNIVEGAKYHHERWDGSGYPEGLKGEEIPLIARIICCADCYDAMATKRTYKDPYPKEKIIDEFEKCAGSQFDPNMAKVVVELIKTDELREGA